MKVLNLILVATAVQYVVNLIIVYSQLSKNSNLKDYWNKLTEFNGVIWIPIIGILIQVLTILSELYLAIKRTIKRMFNNIINIKVK